MPDNKEQKKNETIKPSPKTPSASAKTQTESKDTEPVKPADEPKKSTGPAKEGSTDKKEKNSSTVEKNPSELSGVVSDAEKKTDKQTTAQKEATTADVKKPTEIAKIEGISKSPIKEADPKATAEKTAKSTPITSSPTPQAKEPAKDPVKGVKITQIFADRLDKPDEKALKSLPIPKDGEGFSIRLHPDYFYDFLDHPFSINREVADYKDLYDSIKLNGINEPVKARPRDGGGLELLSGHRRHDIAKQLNYPVPVVIVQMDDDSARIEVVDGNLHRQDIPTSELARAAKMKMEALARKAGRRSKMEQLTNPAKRTDQIVAEDMGMSRNQVNRLIRIDSLVPELKKQVDDKKLPFNTAVELSFLKPEEQNNVLDFMKKEEVVPSLMQATELKEASRAAQAAEKIALKPGNKTLSAVPTPSDKKFSPIDEKKIASIVKPRAEPEQKYTFTSSELKEYFPKEYIPTVSEVKRKVFDALDFQKKAMERSKARQLEKAEAKAK